MRHRVPAAITSRDVISAGKLRWRIPQLGTSHAEPDDAVSPWLDRFDHGKRVALIKLTLDAHDQPSRHAVTLASVIDRGKDVLDNDGDRDTALEMSLRTDEDFGVTNIVARRASKIRRGHLVEVAAFLENGKTEIEEIEE